MKAVLFIGHGSRKREGNENILSFVEKVKQTIDVPIVETGFLEFAAPTISDGIDACVKRGADNVALVPIMFFPAGHSKIHIPHAMDEAKEKYPNVRFTYGRPIGIHPEMVNILQEKLADETMLPEEGDADTAVLLVGRGSSDADANSELFKLSRLLTEKLDHQVVEISYIGVTKPTVEEGVNRLSRLGAKRIIMVPYFFFSGILVDRMDEKLSAFETEYPGLDFSMTKPIGFHPRLEIILEERAKEALQGNASLNCDMCQYRLFAVEHMGIDHHHHHDHDHPHSHNEDKEEAVQTVKGERP
ncbi:sirohydrochlorin chelatase [Alteribacillus bidgolensis]|uniref:Sirohydrochlorin cobaltochelatase n=1 Tax=Alteribacillus bidgolensis TaxID=930129 RepID=A0A1G8CLA5_9BACI|nr:sirohydrochlorin chelatase [Alteribacillus bidgolensis]SDH46166.1 sirohydrochlorin cobaltochelatase [Alteribacillus bidgolensis]